MKEFVISMSLLRAFIAVEIPSSLQHTIQESTASLHSTLSDDLIRWVPPQNVHLTLKFLGDVSSSNLDLIKQMLTAEAAQHQCFEMQVKGIGSFPNSRRPRVIWLGFQPRPRWNPFNAELNPLRRELGYAADEKSFCASFDNRTRQTKFIRTRNSTHPRLRSKKQISDCLASCTLTPRIFSKVTFNPSGSVYTRLFSAKCGGLSAPIGKV